MPTNFTQQFDGASSPARAPYAVTPSDTAELPVVPKGLYVGGGGDVTLRGVAPEATDVTYRNLSDGSYIAVHARFVRATGTTATFIIAEA